MAKSNFYADDVKAEEIADNDLNPDQLNETHEDPVTSGDMEIGDLDAMDGKESPDASSDEESVPSGDKVSIYEDD